MMQAAAGFAASARIYVDDVFSAYTYTGNGATQTINNGIDLAGEGGMVWIKNRGASASHRLFHSARGVGQQIYTDAINGQGYDAATLTAFGATGFTLGNGPNVNDNLNTYISWTFRNATNFYHHDTVVKSSGSNATVDLSTLGTVGMVRVKRTDSTGSWYVWHRSLTAGKLLIGETTAAEATLGHITVSGTTVTLVNGVIADGTYLVEAWAHDTSAEGIIQCGSYVGDATGGHAISIGIEIQYVLIKQINSSGNDFILYDTMRGASLTSGELLYANSSYQAQSAGYVYPNATGFTLNSGATAVNGSGSTYIYLAIRRPNKVPTSGTEVYSAQGRAGSGGVAVLTGIGFPPDLTVSIGQTNNAANVHAWFSRLCGVNKFIRSPGTDAEQTGTDSLTAFGMSSITVGTDADEIINGGSGRTYVHHHFRRAPGVFDIVCYTGTGSGGTWTHNLGAIPELLIWKSRNNGTDWKVWHKDAYLSGVSGVAYCGLVLNSNAAATSEGFQLLNSSVPTATQYTMWNNVYNNASAYTYVLYMFATLAGISKVGSYTGDGTTGKAIACGFTTGARFIMIKRTDSTGDWFVYDTVRGINAGNDPHLSLNSAVAEVNTTDDIDYDAAGFLVNQNATTNLNVTSATYVFLAFS